MFDSARIGKYFDATWVSGCHSRLLTTLQRDFATDAARPASPIKRRDPKYDFILADDDILGPTGSSHARRSVQAEVDSYFAEGRIPGGESPLAWWNANKLRFPTLARMAKVYLAIPGTVFRILFCVLASYCLIFRSPYRCIYAC